MRRRPRIKELLTQSQITQFLLRMANEVDLIELTQMSEQKSKSRSMLDIKAPSFDPMRRKLEIRTKM